ncbi:MAG: sulfur carrier protein ThiS [Prevotella sp.]|nr:sulfur carrier protein ThiS [Prevotella sp.]
MEILINNEKKETKATNVSELAAELALPERGVALAINNRIVTRNAWEETSLNEGDNVTIIKAAFGG